MVKFFFRNLWCLFYRLNNLFLALFQQTWSNLNVLQCYNVMSFFPLTKPFCFSLKLAFHSRFVMILLRILMKIHIWWIYPLNINYGSNQPLFFFSIYASKGFLGLLALRISVYIRILTPNKKGLQGATHIIRISLRKRKTKDIKSYLLTMLLKVIFTILPNSRQFFINVQKYYMGWFLRRLSNL